MMPDRGMALRRQGAPELSIDFTKDGVSAVPAHRSIPGQQTGPARVRPPGAHVP